MYCHIIPFWKTFDNIWFTYFIPPELLPEIRLWQTIEIPFKNQNIFGIIYYIFEEINTDIDITKIKSIISIKNNNSIIDWYRIELLKYLSKNYFTLIHNALNLFIPKNLKEKIIKWKIDFNKTNDYKYSFNLDEDLTKTQEKAYLEILDKKTQKSLLFWVTWSWKTHIYIKLINDYLKKGKQSLILVPEIILSNQIHFKLKEVFWDDIIVINSTVTDATKTKYFLDIAKNKAKIIIWTRSALFYPYSNLWLIIVDEEHDNSYISDQSPRYNSIDVVNKITDLNWNKLVLASWTPSIKTMYDWVNKKYKIINLFEKYKK